MPKRALITGISGQDGSYLTENPDPHQAAAQLTLHYGDLSDGTALREGN